MTGLGDDMMMYSVLGVLGIVVGLAVHIAMLVVGLTSARKASKRAGSLIVLGTSIQLFMSCVSYVVPVVYGRAVGPESMAKMAMITGFASSVLHAIGLALVVAGVAVLANAKTRVPREA